MIPESHPWHDYGSLNSDRIAKEKKEEAKRGGAGGLGCARKWQGRGRGYLGKKGGNPPSTAAKQAERAARSVICFGCGRTGHYKNHCPESKKSSSS